MSKHIKQQVENILISFPDSRNSDALLILNLYRKFYYLPDPVSQQKLLEVINYCNPDIIVRYRRKFNQEKKYLPTNPEIVKARGIKAEEMRTDLGYNNSNYL